MLVFQSQDRKALGFTLTELLLALAILGVVAIFTVPKIIKSQSAAKQNALGREALAAVSQAYVMYKNSNAVSSSTLASDFTPFFNYVKVITNASVDDNVGYGAIDCSDAALKCIKLSNGGVIWADTNSSFCGTTNLHSVYLNYDVDGVYGGLTTGESKALQIVLYYNGRVTSGNYIASGTQLYCSPLSPTADPPWFNW